MNFLTESDIKFLKNCVLHSTLLGHEVEKGNEVLRKLDQALNIANVEGQGEQLPCEHPEDKIWYNHKSNMQCNECGKEL